MVEFITGIKGIGKSRILAETAVYTAESSTGHVVFIDTSTKLATTLPQSIRLINIKDYNITTATSFYGFLTGICASDYDITDIFVDSTLEIFSSKKTSVSDFLDIITDLSQKTNVDFHFTFQDSAEKEMYYQCLTIA